MKINWKVRFKNPAFLAGIILAIWTPILAYAGMTPAELTSWNTVGNLILSAISNPYVLVLIVVSVYNALVDPTTKGLSDSELALTYTSPKDDRK